MPDIPYLHIVYETFILAVFIASLVLQPPRLPPPPETPLCSTRRRSGELLQRSTVIFRPHVTEFLHFLGQTKVFIYRQVNVFFVVLHSAPHPPHPVIKALELIPPYFHSQRLLTQRVSLD